MAFDRAYYTDAEADALGLYGPDQTKLYKNPNYNDFNSQGVAIPGNSMTTPGVTTNLRGSTLGSGISGSTISAPASTSTPDTAIANPASAIPSTPAPSLTAGSLADYFARAIIIVLGFIFIAIGLNMLRPGTVPIGRRG